MSFILMYAEDNALFSNNLDDMQHLLDGVDTFCQISGQIINVDQTKMMAMKAIQPSPYPTFRKTNISGATLQISWH